MLAAVRDLGRYTQQLEGAMKFIYGCCKGGMYGSTQSTVLALKVCCVGGCYGVSVFR